jgi:WD40 repeat protein
MSDVAISVDKPQTWPGGPIPKAPYVGPRPFERSEGGIFYGRDREARDMISLIIANRVLVLYSPSGAGKSSLLNTKVISGLEAEQCWVFPIARVQGEAPFSISEEQVRNIFSLNVLLSLRDKSSSHEESDFYKMTLIQFFTAFYTSNPEFEEPIVLIVDQAEELFTFYEHRWRERAAFIEELIAAANTFPELRVVLSLREDYIAKLDAFRDLIRDKLRARYHLERLSEEAALEAVVRPTIASERHYDEGVAEAIVNDLLETQERDLRGNAKIIKGEFVEPVQLQVVCLNLWSAIPAGEKRITKDHLKQSGSVDEALRRFYDASITHAAKNSNTSEGTLRHWFDTTLITPAGTRGTVFRDREDTAGSPNRVIDALVDRHIIRGDWRSGAQWYEITHDRLLRPIRESNRQWLAHFNRKRLIAFGSTATVAGVAIAAIVGWFYVSTQQALVEAEAVALASLIRDESARQPVSNLDLALLLAVEAVAVKDNSSTRSNLFTQVEKASRIERFDRVSSRNITEIASVPRTPLTAALTIDGTLLLWSTSDGVVASRSVDGQGPSRLFADEGGVYVVSNRQAFSFRVRGEAMTWELVASASSVAERLREALEETFPTAPSNNSNLAQDVEVRRMVSLALGRLLVARDGTLRVIAANTGAEIAHLQLNSQEIGGSSGTRPPKIVDVSLSQDGRFAFALACTVEDRSDASRSPAQKSQPTSPASSCRRRLATVWDIDSDKQLPFNLPDSGRSIAIGNIGQVIWAAIANLNDGITVTRYELVNGRWKELKFELANAGSVSDLSFREDLEGLVSASGGILTAWNVRYASRLERKIRDGLPYDIASARSGFLAAITSAGFFVLGPDGKEKLTGAIAPSGANSDEARFAAIGLTTDGDQVLAAQYGSIELWNVHTHQRALSVNVQAGSAVSVAIDPRGRYMAGGFVPSYGRDRTSATVDFSRVPVLWNIDTGEPKIFLNLLRNKPNTPGENQPPPDSAAVGVAFSPDGRYFVATQGDNSGGYINIYRRSGRPDEVGTFEALPPMPLDNMPYIPAFTADSKLLAVSHENGSVSLIDILGGRLVGKLITPQSGESGRLAFSPNGRLLVVSMIEGRYVLWDAASQTQIGTVLNVGSRDGVLGVALSADGEHVLLGSTAVDGLVELDLRLVSWIRQACDIAHRTLTSAERVQYRLPKDTRGGCGPPYASDSRAPGN